MPGSKVMEFVSSDKVLPDKNPGYKNVNSSSVIYIDKEIKVLPDKNPGYKNVNSSSMTYIEKPVNIIKEPQEQSSIPTSYRYCSII